MIHQVPIHKFVSQVYVDTWLYLFLISIHFPYGWLSQMTGASEMNHKNESKRKENHLQGPYYFSYSRIHQGICSPFTRAFEALFIICWHFCNWATERVLLYLFPTQPNLFIFFSLGVHPCDRLTIQFTVREDNVSKL